MRAAKKATAAGVYRVGDTVHHARLGRGEVLAVADGKADVRFADGEKTLLLGVAPIMKLRPRGRPDVYGVGP